MIGVIILALIFAKVKGYEIKQIYKCKILYPLFVLEVLHIVFQVAALNGNYYFTQYAGLLKSLHLYTVILPMVYYKLFTPGLIGAGCMMIGTLLNNIVIQANGGKMPVYPTLSYMTGLVKPNTFEATHTIHVLGTSESQYKILSDFIDVGYAILSIGDLFVHAFTFIIIYHTIKAINTKENQHATYINRVNS